MANSVSVWIQFETSEIADRALAVAEGMIKLCYVPKELPWAEAAEQIGSLSERYLCFGEEAAKLDPLPEHPNCALKWLRQEGAQLLIERCADLQSPVDVYRPGDFFAQLCLVLTKKFPVVSFSAFCRHEETVSATVQLNRIIFERGQLLCWEMWSLDEEIDENDWSRAYRFVLQDEEGVFVRPKR